MENREEILRAVRKATRREPGDDDDGGAKVREPRRPKGPLPGFSMARPEPEPERQRVVL